MRVHSTRVIALILCLIPLVTGVIAQETNAPPVVVGSIDDLTLTREEGARTLEAAGYFSDADGDALGYSVDSEDETIVAASIDPISGQLTLTPVVIGSAEITVTARDPAGAMVTQTFQARVVNSAPVAVGRIDDLIVTREQGPRSIETAAYFRDADGDVLTYSVSSFFIPVAIDSASGSLTVGLFGSGDTEISVTVTDPSGATARQNIRVFLGNSAPVAVGRIDDQRLTLAAGPQVIETADRFRDADIGATLRYTVTPENEAIVTTDIDSTSGQLTLTPVAIGTTEITVTATDAVETTATQVFQVTVNNSEPVAVGSIADLTLTREGPQTLEMADYFDDADGDNELRYTLIPGNESIVTAGIDATSGRLTLTPVAIGSAELSVIASDRFAAVTQGFRVIVSNAAPAAVGRIEDVVLTRGAGQRIIEVSPHFRDADGDDLSYSVASGDETIVTATINTSGRLRVALGIFRGRSTITVTARDPSGAMMTQVFQVSVVNSAPLAMGSIAELTLTREAGARTLETAAYFSDADANDSLGYVVTLEDGATVTARIDAGSGQLIVTPVAVGTVAVSVTARDPFGGMATQVFQVSVVNSAPATLGNIDDLTLTREAGAGTLQAAAYFRDADEDILRYSVTSEQETIVTADIDPLSGQLTVTPIGRGFTTISVTASDPSAAMATQTLRVVVGNSAPVAVNSIDNLTLVQTGERIIETAAYFRDADGDALGYGVDSEDDTIVSADIDPASGQLMLTPVGRGVTTISVTASDPSAAMVTQVFQVAVDNTAPVTMGNIADLTLTREGGARTLETAAYFSDADGDSDLRYAVSPEDGAIVTAAIDAASGQLTLTPVAIGSAEISVTASDPFGATATQVFQAAVGNSAPFTVGSIDDLTLTREEGARTLEAADYFSDADGDALGYSVDSEDDTIVTANIDPISGQLTLTPVVIGGAEITVTASDPVGAMVTQVFQARVANSAPVAVGRIDDLVVIREEGPRTIDTAAYFRDADGDALTYSIRSFLIAADIDSVSGRLTVGLFGSGSIEGSVIVTDPSGATARQNVRVFLGNSVPVAVGRIDDQRLTLAAGPRVIETADRFRDADVNATLRYTVTPENEAIVTTDIDSSSGQLTLTPVAIGTAEITVTATDAVETTATQVFQVTVNNSAPVAVDSIADLTLTREARARTLETADYFDDADGKASLRYAVISDGAEVSAGIDPISGQLTLTPVAIGSAEISVTASDRFAAVTQRFQVIVSNAAPVAVGRIADLVLTRGQGQRIIEASPHFRDADGDDLNYSVASANETIVSADIVPDSGRLTLTAVVIGSAEITVTARDPSGAMMSQVFQVRVDNTAPLAMGRIDDLVVTREAGAQTLEAAAYFNDADGDNDLRYTVTSENETIVTADIVPSSGQLTLTPIGRGLTTVSVTARDRSGAMVMQAFQVTVNNSAPTTVGSIDALMLTREEGARTLQAADYFRDADSNDLRYSVTSGGESVVTTSIDPASGQLTLTPIAIGTTQVTVTASEQFGPGATVMQVFEVAVVNSAPVAVGSIDNLTLVRETGAGIIGTATYFRDADGDALGYGVDSEDDTIVSADIDPASGQLTLTPIERGVTTITVTATASDSSAAMPTQVFQVAVDNATPIAVNSIADLALTREGGVRTLETAAYFSDADSDLRYTVIPEDEAAVTVAIDAASGQLTLTPVAIGSAEISVTASDPFGATATQVFEVAVGNSAPFTVGSIADLTRTRTQGARPLETAGYFADADGNDSLGYTVASDDEGAVTANIDPISGQLTLTLVAIGTAEISVTARDPAGAMVTQAFQVSVANSVPVRVGRIDDQFLMLATGAQTLEVAAYFRDVDGNDSLRYMVASDDEGVVTASIDAISGRLTLTPMFRQDTAITVTARDPSGAMVTQLIRVTVVNSPPVAVNRIPDQRTTVAAGPRMLRVANYFRDFENTGLFHTPVSSNRAVARVNVIDFVMGRFTLTPIAVGTAQITVTARDMFDATVTQVFEVTVTNSAPVAVGTVDSMILTREERTRTLEMATYFNDADDKASLRYAVISEGPGVGMDIPNGVSADIDPISGRLTLTPIAIGFSEVTVTVGDPLGATATQSFSVRVDNAVPVRVGSIEDRSLTVAAGPQTFGTSAYFRDVDGDVLIYDATSGNDDIVTVALGASGRLTLTPIAIGTTQVSVTAQEHFQTRDGATQVFQVTVGNSAPVAVGRIDDLALTREGGPHSLETAPHFREVDGDDLSYSVSVASADASIVTAGIDPDSGRLTLTPLARGFTTISVTASDPSAATMTQVFQVAVDNTTPVAVGSIADLMLSREAGARSLETVAYFHDADGDTLTYDATSADEAVVIASIDASSGRLRLTPVGHGSTTISVTASDPSGIMATQTFQVEVSNNTPVAMGAIADLTLTREQGAQLLETATYFRDVDGDALNYSVSVASADETIVSAGIDADSGQLTLTPLVRGDTTISVTASDPSAAMATQTFQVSVANSAPVAVGAMDELVLTSEQGGRFVEVLPYFRDADDDSLSYRFSSGDARVVMVEDNIATTRNLFVLAVGRGRTTITMTASDPFGATANQVFQVTVDNAAPVAVGGIEDVVLTREQGPRTLGTAAYFSDAEDNDDLGYSVTLEDEGIVSANIDADSGQLTLTPVGRGDTTISVTARDPSAAMATQVFEVSVANSVLVAVGTIADRMLRLATGSRAFGTSAYFRDADGDALGYSVDSENETIVSADIDADSGRLTLTPVVRGDTTISVTASGSSGAMVTQRFQVVVTNSAPVATGGRTRDLMITREAGPQTLETSVYFRDPDGDILRYEVASGNEALVTADIDSASGRVTVTSKGRGNAIITVTARDPSAAMVRRNLRVFLNNSAPVAVGGIDDQSLTVVAGPQNLEVATYFRDVDGDTLIYSVDSGNGAVVSADIDSPSAQLTLTPVSPGRSRITVTASDSFGGMTTQVFQVAVGNSAPVVVSPIADQNLTVMTGPQTLETAAYFNDAEDNDGLRYSVTPGDETIVIAGIDSTSGRLLLTPVGRGFTTLTVTARDRFGAMVMQDFQVTVNNSAPVAVSSIGARNLAVAAGPQTFEAAIYFRDADDNDSLTYTVTPEDEMIVMAGIDASSGRLTLTPAAIGTTAVSVTASDPSAAMATQVFQVSVGNSAPVLLGRIAEQNLTVAAGPQPLETADYFQDADGNDSLIYTVTPEDERIVTADIDASSGRLMLTPVAIGTAEVTVTVRDLSEAMVTQVFQVSVGNSAPTAVGGIDDLMLTRQQGAHSLETAAYFRDADGDALGYSVDSEDETIVSANIDADSGQLTLTPVGRGDTTISVTARDPSAAMATQVFEVSVANSVLVAVGTIDDRMLRLATGRRAFGTSAYFRDADGDALAGYSVDSENDTIVTADIDADSGRLTLTPVVRGAATISVTASGSSGAMVTQRFRVVVANSAPVSTSTTNLVVSREAGPQTLEASAYFRDADGDILRYEVTSGNEALVSAEVDPASGRVTVTYKDSGIAIITVAASDPSGARVRRDFRVFLNNSAPVAVGAIDDQNLAVVAGPQNLEVSTYFRDADGDTLIYSADSGNEAIVSADIDSSSGRLTLTPVSPGRSTITVTARDPSAAMATQVFQVYVDNSAPVAVGSIGARNLVVTAGPQTLETAGYFSDAEGGGDLRYSVSLTPGDEAIVIAGINAISGRLLLTPVGRGRRTITVTTIDPPGAMATQVFQVAVINPPPTADAGAEQSVAEGTSVTLDGSDSSDPGGENLSYAWTQIGTPTVTLTSEDSATPSFTAPTELLADVELVFSLIVNNGESDSSADTVTITTTAGTNDPPTADAGAEQTVAEGVNVTLNGSGSSDPESANLGYAWTQTSGTPTVTLTGEDTATPTFTAPSGLLADVELIFSLIVNDGENDSSAATVTITTTAGPNNPPTADAGADQTVTEGASVTLNGSGSSDPEGASLSYAWTQVGTPAVALTGEDTATPTFTAPRELLANVELVFSLIVNDSANDSSAATVTITTTAGENDPPIAVATAMPNPTDEGATVTLDGSGSSDPEGEDLIYAWTQTSGATVSLSDTAAESPTFMAPDQLLSTATLAFELIVTEDRTDGSASPAATVSVTISAGTNDPPTAVATATPNPADEGASVTLDGSGSSDPEGEDLIYAWSQTSGATVSLSDTAAESPTFMAPDQLLSAATLDFELIVTEDRTDGSASPAATVSVTISAGTNDPPTADAGADQTVAEGASVTLNGSGSSDPEGANLTYTWTQTSGTPTVTLTGEDTAAPTFTAPENLSANAVLIFSLTVNDGVSNSSAATVTITAGTNDPPTADAGADQTVAEGASVTLDGSGSSDPEGASLTYAWTQTNGTPTVTLTGDTTATPTFTAPADLLTTTSLEFSLVVNDGESDSQANTVTITITGVNDPPIANAGADQTVAEGASVTLNGSASADPEDEDLTYAWTQVGTSTVTLNDADTATPTFTAPTELLTDATLAFQLIVTEDRTGGQSSSPATVSVTITAGTNDPPTAVATATPNPANEGVMVTLNGSASADPEGEGLTYAWTQVGTPTVPLSGDTTATPTFTAPTELLNPETLAFQLIVTEDRTGGQSSSPATVSVTITAGDNDPPTAVATATPNPANEGVSVTLNGSASSDPEDEDLTYAWSQTSGEDVSLTGENTATPTFTAPTELLNTATLAFQLIVTEDRTGGSASDPATVNVIVSPGTNDPPTANAGADQTVAEGASVTLNGSASADPEGEDLTYAWTQVGTSTVTLNDADTATPTFTAPTELLNTATLVFQLIVTEDRTGGSQSDPATVNVIVSAGTNDAPTANAGADQTVAEGASVTLNGSASADPEDEDLTYAWTQVGTPTVTLNDADTATPTFTAPTELLADATLTFQLIVTEDRTGGSASAPATVNVIVSPGTNDPPTANAGADQTVAEGASVTLNGSASADPEDEDLTYAWTQTGGTPTVPLTGDTTVTPTFTAPTELLNPETLVFQLIVTEDRTGGSQSDPATVNVIVSPGTNDAPIANAGADQTVAEGASVTLNGSASADPEGEDLTYAWTQVGTPTVPLTGQNTATPTFTAPTELLNTETLVFQLIVTEDRTGGSQSDPATVNVIVSPGTNDAPIANAGANQTVAEGVTVTLNGSASSDPEGEDLTYAWTQTGGEDVSLTGDTTATPTFTAPVQLLNPETLVFQLIVTEDRTGGQSSSPATVNVTITAGTNDPPTANAGADQSVAEGVTVTLNGSASADPEGEDLTYAWTQTGGTPTVPLTGDTTATPTFTAPTELLNPETLVFQLIVTEDRTGGQSSSPATVNVTITAGTNDPPTADAGSDQTVAEGATVTLNGSASADPEGEDLTYAWTQVGTSTVTLNDADTIAPTFTAPENLSADVDLVFSLTVNDGVSGSQAATVTITVGTNTPPTISGTPATSVVQGGTYIFTPDGGDVDTGDTLEYAISNLPDWADFDTATGALTNKTGRPNSGDVGNHEDIIITVTDGIIATPVALATFAIEVTAPAPTNTPPTISGAPQTSVVQGGTYSFTPGGGDVDTGDTLLYAISNLPDWADFSTTTGALTNKTGRPNSGDVGNHEDIVITVTDGIIATPVALATFAIEVTAPAPTNTPPTISGSPATSVAQGGTYSFTPGGGDVDTGDTLLYAISNLPDWADFSTTTGALTNKTGRPNSGDVGNHEDIIITVTDGIITTPVALATFAIEVTAPAPTNTPPTISGSPATSVAQGGTYSFTPGGGDVDTGDTLLYAISNLPDWADFSTTTGALTNKAGRPNSGDVGNHEDIVISVTDGNIATPVALATFAIEVTAPAPTNTPPTISGSPATSVAQGGTYSFTPGGGDVDTGDTLLYAISNLPDWADFSTTTGALTNKTGRPNSGDVGNHEDIIITVTDNIITTPVALSAFDIEVTATAGTNVPPTANAGANQRASKGTAVTLDGTGSDDPDGDNAALTYLWSQDAGPTVTLSSTAAAQPTFTIPNTIPTSGPASYTFRLIVSGGALSSAPVTVRIFIRPLFRDTIANQTYSEGNAITALTLPEALAGPGSAPSTNTYTLAPLPAGLAFNATSRILSGTPTTAGTTDLTYTATNGDGDTDSLSFSIAVTSAANTPPTTSAFTVTTNEDTDYTFTVANFPFTDTDGDMLEQVRIDTLPASANGSLALGTGATPVNMAQVIAVADIPTLVYTPATNVNGAATFTFSVSDGDDFSTPPATATVTVTAVNDAASGLPTISGAPRVGATLTANTNGISDADGPASLPFTYQWNTHSGGTDTAIGGATSASYLLTADDVGDQITVSVRYSDAGNTNEGPLTSVPTALITASSTPAPPPPAPGPDPEPPPDEDDGVQLLNAEGFPVSGLTIVVGETREVSIQGGFPPFFVSGDPGGTTRSVVAGRTLLVTGVNAGQARLRIRDIRETFSFLPVNVTTLPPVLNPEADDGTGTEAVFRSGASSDGGDSYFEDGSFPVGEELDIVFTITPRSIDVGEQANVVVAARSASAPETVWLLTQSGLVLYDGETLAYFEEDLMLEAGVRLINLTPEPVMLSSAELGNWELYIGYQLDSGELLYHTEPLRIEVVE